MESQKLPNLTFESRSRANEESDSSRRAKKHKSSWEKKYTRAVMPLLSKIINLKIERGEYKAEEYEGLLDNLNRYIILSLDDNGIKFEKPIPPLTCDCGPCRSKIRAMKGRMSDAFFYKEPGSCPAPPDAKTTSRISMQSYLYAKGIGDKSSFPPPGTMPDFSKKSQREGINSVFRQQVVKTKKEILEDKKKHKLKLLEQAERLAEEKQEKKLQDEFISLSQIIAKKEADQKKKEEGNKDEKQKPPQSSNPFEQFMKMTVEKEKQKKEEDKEKLQEDKEKKDRDLQDALLDDDFMLDFVQAQAQAHVVQVNSKPPEPSNSSAPTACPICTFINQAGVNTCEICMSPLLL